jgi:pimeloyl-ACP methyl ester carboxylesterase
MNNLRKYGHPPFGVAVVHGGPGAAGEVAPVAEMLGNKIGVLEPIQTSATVDGQVEELTEVIKRHALIPVVLIGHSWGAWLSYIVTARFPELVTKLILVGSGPFVDLYAPAITENRLRRLQREEQEEYREMLTKLNESDDFQNSENLSRLGELVHKADSYDLIEEPTRKTHPIIKVSETIYKGVWPEAARMRATSELLRLSAHIRCPVVAIHGEYDPHPSEGVRVPLSGMLKEFRMIVLEKCGHIPWLETYAQKQFYSILEDELELDSISE